MASEILLAFLAVDALVIPLLTNDINLPQQVVIRLLQGGA